jgi:AcrR family transcriptional regulator
MAGARGPSPRRARPRPSGAERSGPSRAASGRSPAERRRVAEVQRRRLLAAAAQVACEQGAAAVTASNVLRRSGLSRRTFYELFADSEQCLLAVLQDALERATAVAVPAWRSERNWPARVRAALAELLCLFDQDAAAARLLVVESLAAGPRALRLRAQVLKRLAAAVDQGPTQPRAGAAGARPLTPLTAEGAVGGVLSILHARLLDPAGARGAPLSELTGALTSLVVLPYLGAAAAARELERPAPVPAPATPARSAIADGNALAGLPIRLTHRTMRVLLAVGELGGRGIDPSNRAVGAAAGIADQGQISKLLHRLEGVGLVENRRRGAPERGMPNAWALTPLGETVERMLRGAGDADTGPAASRR